MKNFKRNVGFITAFGIGAAGLTLCQNDGCDQAESPIVSYDAGETGTFTPYQGSGETLIEGSGMALSPEQREAQAEVDRIVDEFGAYADELLRETAIPDDMSLEEALEVDANPDDATSGERLAAINAIWDQVQNQESDTFMALEAEVQRLMGLQEDEFIEGIENMGYENFVEVITKTESQDILDWAAGVMLEGDNPSPTAAALLGNPSLSPEILGSFEHRSIEEEAAILGNSSSPLDRLNTDTVEGAYYAIISLYESYRNGEITDEQIADAVQQLTRLIMAVASNPNTPQDKLDFVAGLIIDPTKRPFIRLYEWQFNAIAHFISSNESLSLGTRTSLYGTYLSTSDLDPINDMRSIYSSYRFWLINNATDPSFYEFVIQNETHEGLLREAQSKIDEIERRNRPQRTPEEAVRELLSQ